MKAFVIPFLSAVDLPNSDRGFGKVPGLLLSDVGVIVGISLAQIGRAHV